MLLLDLVRHTVHGSPGVIVSDRGSAFISQIFKEMTAYFNIEQKFATSYHPQTSGLVERSNRSILNALRAFTNSRQDDWDEFLAPTIWSLNTADSHAMGYSYFIHV